MKGGSEKNEQQTQAAFSQKEQRQDQAADSKKGAEKRNEVPIAFGIPSSRVPEAKQKARCIKCPLPQHKATSPTCL